MKTLLTLAFYLFSTLLFAAPHDACMKEFNKGIDLNEKSSTFFEAGVTDFNQAVTESNQRSPKVHLICELLLNSLVGFDQGFDEFKRCSSLFSMASTTCKGPDRDSALGNKNVCFNNSAIAKENYEHVLKSYKGNCYRQIEKISFSPLLQLEK